MVIRSFIFNENLLIQQRSRKTAAIACLCFSLAAVSLASFAQTSDNWYLSKVLNDNNGLPQNSVTSMYFDKRTGFLWLTTEAGLARYDGATTKVFDLRDLPALRTIRIWYLFPSVGGDALACTRLHEVFAIKNNSVINQAGYTTNYDFYKSNAKSLRDLDIERKISDGLKWRLGSIRYSVWLNDSTWTGLFAGRIVVIRNGNLLAEWPLKTTDAHTFILRKNLLYRINAHGVGDCIDLAAKTQTTITTGNDTCFQGKPVLYYDKLNEQPLLLNGNKLYELGFQKNILSATFIATVTNPPADITSVVVHPNKKFVFVSTNTAGVYIYRATPFIIYKSSANDLTNRSNGLNNNYATVLTDSSHVFTWKSLLFDLNTGTSKKLPLTVLHPESMGLDSSKNIWSATKDNISCFQLVKPGKMARYPLGPDNGPKTFFLSSGGKFWISTRKFLGYANNKKLETYLTYSGKPDSSSFFYLTETAQGQLIGLNRSGIYFIDTGSKKLNLILSSKQVSELRNVHVDSADVLWITTYGKGIFLYRLKEKRLFELPVDDRGYLLFSHAFIDAGQNHFLVPTNKGLFRLQKDNLLKICTAPATPLYYQYFNVGDGLATNEFNGGCQPAFNRLPGGDILLPALQGLVRVKGAELPVPQANPLFVDAVETKMGKHIAAGSIRFDEGERTQTWRLGFAQWEQPNGQNIFYRTDDETAWQRLLPGETAVQLNDLTGGNHRLEIRYQYGLLDDQFSSLQFRFSIAKRFYEAVWFWPAIAGLFGTIIILLIRLRMLQQALKLQAVRNGISADMHDEVGSTLSSISFYSQALLMQTNDEKLRSVLQKIKENAQAAQEGMSDIVWSVKPSMDGMENVFNRMQRFGSEFLEARDIRFHFEADEKLSGRKLNMADRKNLYLIFKEALHNAAKYAGCATICVKIESAAPRLRLTVKDDGKGFDVQAAKSGNGLSNMSRRAAQLNGRLSVQSAPMQGTRVILMF